MTIFRNTKPCVTKELKGILKGKKRVAVVVFYSVCRGGKKQINRKVKRVISQAKTQYKYKIKQKFQ